ncbi:MAG: hypothetical protein H6619_02950 [Deltaproteobacteria bacterium]|nr:hypothetical protein [Deltaproteobacteria bacterium]
MTRLLLLSGFLAAQLCCLSNSSFALPLNLGSSLEYSSLQDSCTLSANNRVSNVFGSANGFDKSCEGQTLLQDAGAATAMVTVMSAGYKAAHTFGSSCFQGYPVENIATFNGMLGDVRSIFASISTAFQGQFLNESNTTNCLNDLESCTEATYSFQRQVADHMLGQALHGDPSYYESCSVNCDEEQRSRVFAEVLQFSFFVVTDQLSPNNNRIECQSNDVNETYFRMHQAFQNPNSIVNTELNFKACSAGYTESCAELVVRNLFDLGGACERDGFGVYTNWQSVYQLPPHLADAVCNYF